MVDLAIAFLLADRPVDGWKYEENARSNMSDAYLYTQNLFLYIPSKGGLEISLRCPSLKNYL